MAERDLSGLDEFVYIVRMVVKEVIFRYVITWDHFPIGYGSLRGYLSACDNDAQ